jgi:hypothetical protein
MPLTNVPQVWKFNISNFVAGGATKTSNVTRVFVSIDPAFHT